MKTKAKEFNLPSLYSQAAERLTVDPTSANPGERASKLRSQQEVLEHHDSHVRAVLMSIFSSVKVLPTSWVVKRPVFFSGRG